VYAVAAGAAVGRAYSLTFSRTYPASPVLGSGSFVNAGDDDAYPLIRIYGPVTEPVLDNNTQGKSLTFAGLTLSATEYLEIDTRAKTILLNGDTANSRYDKLVFPTSDWWWLSPGINLIRFHPATFTDGVTLAELTWRDALQ
jgi:phage-related protein